MVYVLDFTERAIEDISFHRKSGNKNLIKKIHQLLNDTLDHPFEGLGKPEALKYDLLGFWSRRINKEHRIVYKVREERIIIHSLKGHY
ncbi:MAG: Txe/YoeB family addiction module toxin [Aequorivita sp.]